MQETFTDKIINIIFFSYFDEITNKKLLFLGSVSEDGNVYIYEENSFSSNFFPVFLFFFFYERK